MKVIDLLNKIANGEEVPEQIQFRCFRYKFDKSDRLYRNTNGNRCIGHDFDLDYRLNEGVTVIEENNKIKTIKTSCKEGEPMTLWTGAEIEIIEKVNEIIDKINGGNNE